MKTDCWGTFMITGQVLDYLEYRRQEEEKECVEKRGAEDGTECCTYRDGASDDACW